MKAQRPVIQGTTRYCQVGLTVDDLRFPNPEGYERLLEDLHGALEFDDVVDVFGAPGEPHLIVTGRAEMDFGTEEALLQKIAGIIWERSGHPATVSLDLTYFIENYQGKFTTEEEDWRDWKAHAGTP